MSETAERVKKIVVEHLGVEGDKVTEDNLLVRISNDAWDRVLDTNLRAAFVMIRTVARGMMRRRSGRIINITSVVGITGNKGQANYAASKAGLVGLSKALAQEVGSRGITVNCIAPGFIRTPMTDVLPDTQKEVLLRGIPAGRLGEGEEIGAAAVYLASREAGYITGQTLHVNGGMAMI